MQTGMGKGLSPAVAALGMGDALSQQVASETEEQRKKRLREAQERSLTGPAAGAASMLLGGAA